MPLGLLRRPTLRGGMLVTAAFMASFGLQFFFLTMYLQSSLHESPLMAGVSFLSLALLVVVGNRVGGRLATRYGAGRVLPWGLAIGTVGLLAYDLLGPRLSLPTLLAGEAIAGFGQGITFTTAYLVAESAAGDVRALVLDCKRLLREWRLPPGSPTRRCAGRSPG